MVYIIHTLIGKTCEDVRKYRDFKIVLNKKRASKLIAKPAMKRVEIYEEDLATFEMKRSFVTMDKPR